MLQPSYLNQPPKNNKRGDAPLFFMQTLKQLIIQKKTPLIMGILNVTPDSFSDGGKYLNVAVAVKHAMRMIEDGALIIDIGGESTRPSAHEVPFEEEKNRVEPIIKALRKETDIYISLDTNKPVLMKLGIDLGVNMINDIYALAKPDALNVISKSAVDVCLMHMKGSPETMQNNPTYHDVLSEVDCFLREKIQKCVDHGIDISRVMIDPGFGFGKSHDDNMKLFSQIDLLASNQCPLMIGLSRKSMIKNLVGENEGDIIQGSALMAAMAGKKGAKVLRVHDVKATKIAIELLNYL
ncbi:MAG: dihydropteroate synthase [Proteobacteria bacterium]|nr:dihydropteroate synthase [Pseudomonadota bacterium]